MTYSRRQFVLDSIGLSGVALGASLVPGTSLFAAGPARSIVAHVRRPGVTDKDGSVDGTLVQRMVYRAMQLATGQGSAHDAFASLFAPTDVVGIKVNCLAGRRMSTRPEVALAVARGLRLAGLKPSNIVIWERSSRELARAGYRVNKSPMELRVIGTDGDYDRTLTEAGSVGGCLTRIVSRLCTAQINAPVLKDHDLAGVSMGLKNWYGAIHNPNKFHGNNCAPYVADLSARSPLRQLTRLVVCDALFAQCNGGPAHAADFVWRHDGVLVSTDPVAIDTVGAELIEQRRRARGLPSLTEAGRPPRWLAMAAAQGLGQVSPDRIRILKS